METTDQRNIVIPDQDLLDEIIGRIVDVANPEKIVLFGSMARGDARADSDLDLMVVKRGAHRRKLAQAIYRRLVGVGGHPVDVIVVTPEDLEQYRNSIGLVIASAVREGKTIYAS